MKEIRLTKGYVAMIDESDFEAISAYKWHATLSVRKTRTCVYAARRSKKIDGKSKYIYMHISLMEVSGVDHRDGNGLNNQRRNLRVASQSQNLANRIKSRGTSVFKGVSWHNRSNKWLAQIAHNGSYKYLGVFSDEVDAATAYNFAAEEAFGEFARLNTPLRDERDQQMLKMRRELVGA